MWGFGNANDPHRIYYSTPGDHEDFTGTGSGSILVYPGEGLRLAAGISFAGRLFLWKYPHGIYWIDDSSTTLAEWKAKRLSRAIGMAGPLGLAMTDSDVVFMSSDGYPQILTAVQEFGDAKSAAIMPEKIGKFIRENADINRLDRAVAENERRIYQLTRQAQKYTAGTDPQKLYDAIRAAEKLQRHNNRLFKIITRTEDKLSWIARQVADKTREVNKK